MAKIKWPIVILISNLIVISLVVLLFLNRSYPMVGHDYAFNIPQMLDTFIHFRVNGLSVQWYTPSFGGGLPAYPNPNNSQFSILELLTLLMQPWDAAILSTIIYISLGGIASYYLFKRVLRLHWTSSILGMVFFSANGFMMQRIAVGHLGYQTFPVIAIILVALLDSSISWGIAGLIFAFVVTMLIHQSGYFIIVTFGLSMLMIFPLVYILRPDIFSWKRLIGVISLGGVVALVMSASKLAAVFSFMRFFPREMADHYLTSPILSLFGITLQLLGTMNLMPLFWAARLDPNLLPKYLMFVTGGAYGYWEFDMSMSPIVFVILIAGVYRFFRSPRNYFHKLTVDRKWITWIFFILFTWLALEFTLANGWIYPHLRKLPILSSLHVNARFAAAFLFPLALSAAALYNRWITKWSRKKCILVFIILNVTTLLPLGTYFLLQNDPQRRSYNITESQEIYASILSGDSLEITGIGAEENNTQALSNHVSNLNLYEPIFGYMLENFHPEIKPGSIWDVSDGYYNMTNPAGYVFPEINGSRPFERIPVSEGDKLEAFANHRQPDWKIPLYQQVLDWVSGLAFVFVVAALGGYGLRRSWRLLSKRAA